MEWEIERRGVGAVDEGKGEGGLEKSLWSGHCACAYDKKIAAITDRARMRRRMFSSEDRNKNATSFVADLRARVCVRSPRTLFKEPYSVGLAGLAGPRVKFWGSDVLNFDLTEYTCTCIEAHITQGLARIHEIIKIFVIDSMKKCNLSWILP